MPELSRLVVVRSFCFSSMAMVAVWHCSVDGERRVRTEGNSGERHRVGSSPGLSIPLCYPSVLPPLALFVGSLSGSLSGLGTPWGGWKAQKADPAALLGSSPSPSERDWGHGRPKGAIWLTAAAPKTGVIGRRATCSVHLDSKACTQTFLKHTSDSVTDQAHYTSTHGSAHG
jgi:hypothetical protein